MGVKCRAEYKIYEEAVVSDDEILRPGKRVSARMLATRGPRRRRLGVDFPLRPLSMNHGSLSEGCSYSEPPDPTLRLGGATHR
jgi:hypothetical protein